MSAEFDAVILDIDGTIWNTTGIVAVAWNKAVEKTGYGVRKVNAQILQKEFGKTMDVIAADLWPELEKEKRDILLAECCTEEQIAIRNNDVDITYPGVVDTIVELSSQENFYIVSNCQNGYIELMLEKTGLAPYVKDFECFGRTGKGKAENLIILKDRNQLSFPLYVGDTQGDCNECIKAGISFAWASYGFGTASSYYKEIKKFSDLKNILK
ncbi:HAD hydrolase-like protein [Treponema sp.]|uniref:HAD family hydrolase n=1 Tax=Treponema sp. TaxID=166 RepID=UPI00257B9F13|nr:HAD hydrolase-like protein [Treponema sp.]MBE6354802.1 HAD family hydrolase [Treponema sp.]